MTQSGLRMDRPGRRRRPDTRCFLPIRIPSHAPSHAHVVEYSVGKDVVGGDAQHGSYGVYDLVEATRHKEDLDALGLTVCYDLRDACG